MTKLAVFLVHSLVMLVLITGMSAAKAAPNQSLRSDSDIARDVSSRPTEIMRFAGINEGTIVLDLFAGGGYYSQLLNQQVGKTGEVVMHNNAAYLAYVESELAQRSGDEGFDEVTQLVSEALDLKLPEGKFDVVFMVLSFHDFYFTADDWNVRLDQVMPQIRRSLKPQGKVLIIDHSANPGSSLEVAQTLHRIDENRVVELMLDQQFSLIAESDVLRNPNDTRTLPMGDPAIRRKTDRFVHLYTKAPITTAVLIQ